MHESKLIASVVLFRELYDRKKDIYDVLGELLKAAFIFEKKWSFNATEATQLLETTFDFKIPEAVVKTTLSNRLCKKEKILLFNNGIYTITPDKYESENFLTSELEATKNKQVKIIDDLILYIGHKSIKNIDSDEKLKITNNFYDYLLNNDKTKTYSSYISSYIIERQSVDGFSESLNAVREGFVLYNGVRHSSDFNNLGIWTTELTIYLDTAHLFYAAGYNGVLYKQFFDDFHGLIKEVNKKKKFITLKYFEECQLEIESFFHSAESIVEGKAVLDLSKAAMQAIVNGSKTKSDILAKKASFFSLLESKNISLETRQNFYDEQKYNIEGLGLIEKLKTDAIENGWKYDEDSCRKALKIFTKINVLRKGINNGSFENIRFIMMSGNRYTQSLAFNPLVHEDNSSIPFATDIGFITNRLWFKLKKGLDHQASMPKSFDVVAKAQVVLSSQINTSVADKFDLMKKELSEGKITKKEAEYLFNDLRNHTTNPENITPDNIEDSLYFLSHSSLEVHLREKSILEKKAIKGDEAVKELEAIKQKELKRKQKLRILKVKIKFGLLLGLLLVAADIYVYFLYKIYLLKGPNDTPLGTFGTLATVVLGTMPFFKYKKIKIWFERKINESTLKAIGL